MADFEYSYPELLKLPIPEFLREKEGTTVTWRRGSKADVSGELIDHRWYAGTVVTNDNKERWAAVQLKIKPTCGFNRNRAVWTNPWPVKEIPLAPEN